VAAIEGRSFAPGEDVTPGLPHAASTSATSAKSLNRTGIAVAAVLGRYLQSQIYDVSTLDPTTFLAVAAVLLSVAAVACGLPALRASRTDPVVALRHE